MSRAVVLLVEDEPDVRSLTRQTLEMEGYAVLAAADGEEALRLYHEHAGSVDLVVTDVLMPRMNGFELAKRLTATRPRMKVLYISAYADETTASAHGVTASVLRKPFPLKVLIQTVPPSSLE
jgi:CheY-like chemotaxis protein